MRGAGGGRDLTLKAISTAVCIEVIQQYLALYENWVGFLWNINHIFQNHSLQLIRQKTLQRVKLAFLPTRTQAGQEGQGWSPMPYNFSNFPL